MACLCHERSLVPCLALYKKPLILHRKFGGCELKCVIGPFSCRYCLTTTVHAGRTTAHGPERRRYLAPFHCSTMQLTRRYLPLHVRLGGHTTLPITGDIGPYTHQDDSNSRPRKANLGRGGRDQGLLAAQLERWFRYSSDE